MPLHSRIPSRTLDLIFDLRKLKRNHPWERDMEIFFESHPLYLNRALHDFKEALHSNTNLSKIDLCFDPDDMSRRQLKRFLQTLIEWLPINSNLRTFIFNCNGMEADDEDFIALTRACAQHPNLQELHLDNFRITKTESMTLAIKTLEESRSLRSISIKPNNQEAPTTKAMLGLLNTNPGLEALGLPLWQELPQDELKGVCHVLRKNQTLKKLEINERNNDDMLGVLAKILKHNHSIHTLKVNGHHRIGATGISALAKGLGANKNLEEIDIGEIRLEESPVNEKVLTLFFEALKQNPIKRLKLGFRKLNNNAVIKLADLIMHLPDLEALHLMQDNSLNNQNLITLSKAIEKNSNIKSLSICLDSRRNYSDSSLDALIKAIENKTGLVALAIHKLTPLPNSFTDKLAQTLKSKKSLISLSYTYYATTNADLRTILEALKDHTALTDWQYYDYNINHSESLKHKAFLKRNRQLAWLKESFEQEVEIRSDDNSASSAMHESNDDTFKKATKIVKSLHGHPEHERLGQTILNSFTLRNYLASNNILQALAYFDAKRGVLLNQCGPLLARAILVCDDYSFLANKSVIKKRAFQQEAKALRMKASIALLSPDFQNPDSEALLLKSVYQLLNPKERHLPEALSYQNIAGFERLIPLAYLQTLMSALIDTSNPSARRAWERISENLHLLPRAQLSLLCQEEPLKTLLEQELGTSDIALFETLLTEDRQDLLTGMAGKQEADKAVKGILDDLVALIAAAPPVDKEDGFENALEQLLAIAKEYAQVDGKKSSKHSRSFFQPAPPSADAADATEDDLPRCNLM